MTFLEISCLRGYYYWLRKDRIVKLLDHGADISQSYHDANDLFGHTLVSNAKGEVKLLKIFGAKFNLIIDFSSALKHVQDQSHLHSDTVKWLDYALQVDAMKAELLLRQESASTTVNADRAQTHVSDNVNPPECFARG